MSTPDVMTQNSAYSTSDSADATDSKTPDVMTQNSAYMESFLLLMMATRSMKTLLQISGL